jgi:glycosyltransferase involved in cell wall biosynthesis
MKEDPLAGKKLTYVLITPARNEEAYIGETIQSMIAQTVLPLRWVVISDGSTDGTDGIVQSYSNQMPGSILCGCPNIRIAALPIRRIRSMQDTGESNIWTSTSLEISTRMSRLTKA